MKICKSNTIELFIFIKLIKKHNYTDHIFCLISNSSKNQSDKLY